jgi:adenylate cyclase
MNAQLISAETGAHLWADQFDTDRGDLLTMQDEIVTRLARALELEMGVVEAARVARTRPGNQDAEDLALRCQAGFDNSATGSAEREAAYDLCERALQIDQSNVLALSIAAFKYAIWASNGLSVDPQADVQRAEDLAARALALEPNNYRAHVAVAKSEVSIFRGAPTRRWSKRNVVSPLTRASCLRMPPCASPTPSWADRKRCLRSLTGRSD